MPSGTTSAENEKGISMPMLTTTDHLFFFSFLEEKNQKPNQTSNQICGRVFSVH